ncbi:MAG: hypothetical protein AAF907_16770, partial [Planctomycetota bacterium]
DDASLNMSTAVLCDGALYGFSHLRRGQFFALAPSDGALLWSGPGRAGGNATLLAVPAGPATPGRVLALTPDGRLTVFEASGAATSVSAVHRLADGDAWAPPAPLPNGLLIKDRDTLRRWVFPSLEKQQRPEKQNGEKRGNRPASLEGTGVGSGTAG